MMEPMAAQEPVQVMGIVNVTPDSFSDGGKFAHVDAAIGHGILLAAQGAAIVDVGGESTRPGATPVPPAEECDRVVPVVRELAAQGIVVSIDTRNPETAAAALDAGARIVNDVTGFTDPRLVAVAAAAGATVVINHMPTSDPRPMQAHATYADVVAEVRDFLARRIDECAAAGLADIVIDPGIGFGKTTQHNLQLLRHLDALVALGRPVLVGASRKRFIGELSDDAPTDQRLGGSLAAGLAAVARGARILRVHDVAETVQALRLWQAVDQA